MYQPLLKRKHPIRSVLNRFGYYFNTYLFWPIIVIMLAWTWIARPESHIVFEVAAVIMALAFLILIIVSAPLMILLLIVVVISIPFLLYEKAKRKIVSQPKSDMELVNHG